jgi:hypothetical protein
VRGRRLLALLLAWGIIAVAAVPIAAESFFARDALGRWLEGYDLRAEGMGGVAIAIRDSFPHSQVNPATYAFASRSSGYVSAYPELRWLRFRTGERWCPEGLECPLTTVHLRQSGGHLGAVHGLVALPRRARLAFGIRQTNDVQYDRTNLVALGDSGEVRRREEGTGGYLTYSLGVAWRPGATLALGIEGQLVSGIIRDVVHFDFDDPETMRTRDEVGTRIRRAFSLRIGVLGNVGRWHVGGFVATAASGQGRRSWRNTSGVQLKEDFDIVLPPEGGLGVSADVGQNWRVGLDLLWRGWSRASFPEDGDGQLSLRDTWRIGLGVERAGRVDPRSRFGEGVSFRAGLAWDPWYFEDARGRRIQEASLSVGVGLPVARDRGRIEALARLGRRWLEGSSRPDEVYVLLGLGIAYASMPRGF